MAARFTGARWWRHGVAMAMAVVVVAGVLTVVTGVRHRVAAPDDLQRARSVPGGGVAVQAVAPDPAAAGALDPPAAVRWPDPATAELDPTAGGPVRAGVAVLQRASEAGTDRVRLQVLDQNAARAAGVDGVLLRVDGGPAAIGVDYAGFRHAFGGGWSARLRLVRLPDCALSTPYLADCRQQQLVSSRNDVPATTVSGEVVPAVYAVTAAAAGSSGSYAATPLTAAANWRVSTQAGDFGWSYPFRVPPTAGGLEPELALQYSSGSIDGRTVVANNQPSWIGEGFDLSPGYVERQYKSCADDVTPKTGDLCWGTENATLVLGGRSTKLVKDSATGAWRPEEDGNERIEYLTGATNGDDNGEWWRVTTPDGTQYHFGRNRLPNWSSSGQDTNSAWTVPVYGDDAGEPCHAATFAGSSCTQAWRWHLDRVVDAHGNSMAYFYQRETNRYGANRLATGVSYVRGGWLSRIEYGYRSGAELVTTPPARVVFGVSERCLTNCGTLTASTAANWPDVPYDQNCDAGASCAGKHSPTFWSRKRLTSVTTQVWGGTAYRDVDAWTLTHTFPPATDGSGRGLWLEEITHTGKVGGTVSLPAVNFDGVQRPNRVDADEGIDPMTKWRVGLIRTESGGSLVINYSQPSCQRSTTPAPESNTRLCYPQYWMPEGAIDPVLDWFHKYVVDQIVAKDNTGGGLQELTSYEYVDGGAWAYDDNELVPVNRRTWSQWRGFEKVRVVEGEVTGQRTLELHRFFRGMDGDHLPGGGVRNVTVRDSEGVDVADHPRLRGFERESIVYNGPAGAEVAGTINDPWLRQTAANGGNKAYLLETEKVRGRTALATGGYRRTEVRTSFDTFGIPTQVSDLADVTTAADDRCTAYSYARNTSVWLLAPQSRAETVSVACGASMARPDDVVSDVRTYHDDATVYGTPAVRGDATRVEELAAWTTGPVYVTASRAKYDLHGRVTEAFDATGARTTTAYTPATGGPVTRTVTTNPLGHATTADLEPAWGSTLATVDPNGKRTDQAYDSLGRLVSVWLPGRAKATQSPNLSFAYLVRTDGPVVVTSKVLRKDGSYTVSYALYDSLLRPRQTQAPAPGGGRVVTDTFYDSRGLASAANAAYYNDQAPSTSVLAVADWQVPQRTVTAFDGANRVTATILVSLGAEKWRTTTTYGGDRTSVDPPVGATATTSLTDARGRTTELRQYLGGAPTGTFDATHYTYRPDGQLATVTDPAGNEWRYGYDLRGRRTSSIDPDRGMSTMEYDDLDRLAATTDARGSRVATTYDALGRKTGEYDGSTAGRRLATWTYDTLAKGQLTSATRHVGTADYISAVTGYDDGYRPLGTSVTIPAAEAGLAGTYTTTMTYSLDGTLNTMRLPAVGNLTAETLFYGYNELGMPTTLQSSYGRWYVSDTAYHKLGMPLRYRYGSPLGIGLGMLLAYEYEESTNRLSRSFVDRELLVGTDPTKLRESDLAYGYDQAGNVLSIVDAPPATSAATDAQCFRYDYLRRMVEAWTPAGAGCATAPSVSGLGGPAPYWHTYALDAVGNRRTEVRHAPAGDTTRTYAYPAAGTAHPHALLGVAVTGAGGPSTDSYGYDSTGNLTSRAVAGVAQTLDWDTPGRLSRVAAGATETTFGYDADGERLIRRAPDAVTVYLDSAELRRDLATGTVTGTRYYSFGGATIAVRNNQVTHNWLFGDHHGTAQLAIAHNGSSVTRRYSTPYGEPRGAAPGSWIGDKGFVGGTADASTGLTHLGTREYEPGTGRFTSVDPLIDYQDPQQMHGYAYANNSPVTFSDPSGLVPLADGQSTGNWEHRYEEEQKASNSKASQSPATVTHRSSWRNNRALRWEADEERAQIRRKRHHQLTAWKRNPALRWEAAEAERVEREQSCQRRWCRQAIEQPHERKPGLWLPQCGAPVAMACRPVPQRPVNWKELMGNISTATGVASVAAGAVALTNLEVAPAAGIAAGGLANVSMVTGVIQTGIECADGGPSGPCAFGIASSAVNLMTFGITGVMSAVVKRYGAEGVHGGFEHRVFNWTLDAITEGAGAALNFLGDRFD